MNWRWILAIFTTLVLIIGGAIALSAGEKPPVDPTKMGTASLSVDKTRADLGTMKADEEKTAIFTILNSSDKILRLWNVTTSCSCTFAKIKIGDKEAGEFNMHEGAGLKNWVGEVPAGGKAELTAIYRPRLMPVVGKVQRQITFATNDPKNQQMEISIEAEVL